MRKQQGRVGGDHQRGSKGFYIARARCRKEFQRRLAIQGFATPQRPKFSGERP